LLRVDVISTNVVAAEVRPAAKRNDVDVDVDADTLDDLFTEVEALPYRTRPDMLSRTDCRVTIVLLPLRLSAPLYTSRVQTT